jgi:hypothetical protein
MVEISINAIFALYFGFFFLFLSGIITWRVLQFSATANRKSLLVLSCMMGLSGLICLFYQRHWFFVLGAAYRVPIYSLIGISMSFALSFSIAELLNFAWATPWARGVAPRAQSALVQTPHQVLLLAVASVTLGGLYGIIFGVSEVGKAVFTMHTLRVRAATAEEECAERPRLPRCG